MRKLFISQYFLSFFLRRINLSTSSKIIFYINQNRNFKETRIFFFCKILFQKCSLKKITKEIITLKLPAFFIKRLSPNHMIYMAYENSYFTEDLYKQAINFDDCCYRVVMFTIHVTLGLHDPKVPIN